MIQHITDRERALFAQVAELTAELVKLRQVNKDVLVWFENVQAERDAIKADAEKWRAFRRASGSTAAHKAARATS